MMILIIFENLVLIKQLEVELLRIKVDNKFIKNQIKIYIQITKINLKNKNIKIKKYNYILS